MAHAADEMKRDVFDSSNWEGGKRNRAIERRGGTGLSQKARLSTPVGKVTSFICGWMALSRKPTKHNLTRLLSSACRTLAIFFSPGMSTVAFASPADTPSFTLPSNAEELPWNGPTSWCRNADVLRTIMHSLSSTSAIRDANEQVIDFAAATTTAMNFKSRTFACHGVAHLSNGQMLSGTYSIWTNAAGDSKWKWMNDEPERNTPTADSSLGESAPISSLTAYANSVRHQWFEYGRENKGNFQQTSYIDTANITRVGDTVTVLNLQDWNPYVQVGIPSERLGSLLSLLKYDCGSTPRSMILASVPFHQHMALGRPAMEESDVPKEPADGWHSMPIKDFRGRENYELKAREAACKVPSAGAMTSAPSASDHLQKSGR